jgi:hypothetical protein
LKPREQLRALKKSVSLARYPKSVAFKAAFDVHTGTLFEHLNREAPHVFHLSGKQNGGDVLMRTDGGGLTRISERALAGMFTSLDAGLQIAIIDTCFSLRCATTIAAVVPFAIGVEADIFEDEATKFYARFYQALGSGRSIRDATSQAASALRLEGVPEARIPQLRCRADVDPAKTFFSGPHVSAPKPRK